MRKNTRDEGALRQEHKRAEEARKDRAARAARKRARRKWEEAHQGTLFQTVPPGMHRFPSGKKVGRPREKDACQRHEQRPTRNPRHPLHVTVKLRAGLPSLRDEPQFNIVRQCLSETLGRFGMNLFAWSVQRDHVHMLVEIDGKELEPQGLPVTLTPKPEELAKQALAKAMKSFGVRTARALNKAWGRKGSVWKERYYVVEIDNPLQMKWALRYVLNNGYKHGECRTAIDPCSSGPYFEFWEEPIRLPKESRDKWPVQDPKTWLAREGWKRHGLIPFPCPLAA